MPEWLMILIRSVLLFGLTLVGARLLGKRQSGQLTFFDVVTGIAIGVIVALLSLNLMRNMLGGIIALVVWAGFPIALHYLSMKSKTVRDFVLGKETILINHGKVLDDKLMEVRLTPEDLLSQLRRKNVFSFADVEFAVMEPTGDISVLLNKEKQPITPKTLELDVGRESVPQTVILDGVMMDEALTAMGFNRGWLHTELEKVGVAPENVFIAQVDSTGQLYLDLFDDAIILPKPKTKELLYATLKKSQADCELFALSTQQPRAKQMYSDSSQILNEVVQDLEPLLKR
ncbi:DUF421 domain-containing protein [Heliobacillus mobilis]|uniref:DUF421 domain-containing protein n=1 Tax=Heliobacterium mobile TaxID=28064 RepID=A0A6I3SL93_HELMO|nr:DUF421 domain-containing protein [Heliobacterium mobile]MTV49525.1 DUF421 domain-containing protein [Heliobacterium mobile]